MHVNKIANRTKSNIYMKRKNQLYFFQALCLLFFAVPYVNAQTIERQSISSYGTSSTVEGITIQQTVGQPYYTSAYSDKEITISPGFQQSILVIANTLADNMTNNFSLSVYPNPVVNSVSVRIPQELNTAAVQVCDMSGKVYFNEKITNSTTSSINCSEWPNGLYLITLIDSNQNTYSSKFIINK